MIICVYKPIKINKNIDNYEIVEIDSIYNKGSYSSKVSYKCDNENCKTPNKIYTIDRGHLNEKRSKTVNDRIQICRSCQTTGKNNPRFGDNRTWDEILGKEKSDINKEIYRKKFIDNNPSKIPSILQKKNDNNMKKYGVNNVFQLDFVKNKSKETLLKKYGVEHPLKSEFIKNKAKETCLNKYGVEHPSKSEFVKNKTKKTCLNKYGVEFVSKVDEFKNKSKKTCSVKYGVSNFTKTEKYRENNFIISNDTNYIKYLDNGISLFRCHKEHNFEISSDNYHSRIKNNIPLCTICNPIGDSKSIKEKELFKFISDIYADKIIQSYRDLLEIDIYLPELNIGFEFNGLYWHSEQYKDKNYHLNKTNYFKEKGIRIIHIWEDDWNFKQEIIKSQIKNLLKLNKEKIFARKCYVKEIEDVKLIRKFLDENHIQGFVNSSLKLGLFYNEELVSVMTFDHFEGRKKMEEGGWNLSRFCNKLNTNVIGGAGKLLNYFIKNYKPKRIVSYADKDWSIGDLYYTLGFENIGSNGSDYKYIIDNKRVHKSRYRKSRLNTKLTESQQMQISCINKIYDCGKIKFERLLYITS